MTKQVTSKVVQWDDNEFMVINLIGKPDTRLVWEYISKKLKDDPALLKLIQVPHRKTKKDLPSA